MACTQICNTSLQKKKPHQRPCGKITIRSVSSEVYSALLDDLLRGHTVPKKERTPHIIVAYRIKMRRIASYATVLNPLNGQQERVLIDVDRSSERKILLKNNEVRSCIEAYYQRYKGVGARKLYITTAKVFCGISERQIQTYINSLQTSQQMHPHFINKQPLKPVKSHGVMEQIQMDLVDMQKSPVEIGGKMFRYELVVLDVFSRFIFLRALQSKSSTEVATHVVQLCSDIGLPKRVQTDQGTDFKGVVEKVMRYISFIAGLIIPSLRERNFYA